MKRLIAQQIITINIQINYEAYVSENMLMVASRITDEQGNIIDQEAYDEYMQFVKDVTTMLTNEFHCDIKKQEQSHSVSNYITFFNTEIDTEFNTMFDLRLSDHKLKSWAKEIRKDKAKKRMKSTEIQEVAGDNIKFYLTNITVNGEELNDYSKALNKVRYILRSEFNKLQKGILQYPKQ